jgi:HK97 gp10 family phage protein
MLKTRLSQIAAELAVRMDAVARAGAERVENGAKVRVHVRSGALRHAIHVERQGRGKYAVLAGDGDAFYGHMEEFGTAHSPPHPFLVPAIEDARDDVIGFAVQSLKGL